MNLTVSDGPALTSAGKTALCDGNADAYNCMAVGIGRRSIGNGVIARLIAALVPGNSSAQLSINSTLGASLAGYFVGVYPRVLGGLGAETPPECGPRLERRGYISK
jgi:hypothetical protein